MVVKPGVEANGETARRILDFCKANLAPYKRVRRLEFAVLPKTISGKIRRSSCAIAKPSDARVANGARRSSGRTTSDRAMSSLRADARSRIPEDTPHDDVGWSA